MRNTAILTFGVFTIGSLVGCQPTPPPPRVPVPASDNADARYIRPADRDYRPLPPQEPINITPPPFADVPLVSQQPPEQGAFVDAYRRVGSPRIVLFVNRTLQGDIVPVAVNDPVVRVEQNRVTPRGESSRSTEVYLRPGQYDEVAAKNIDYEAVETIMTDWLACNGQVTIISPIMARQRLSDEQVKELQAGRPQAMREIVQQLGADILVQMQAKPTRQTPRGLEVRMIVEALNVKGGESVARAVVDVPPPLEKTTINEYTRFMARKLMDGMIGSWLAPPPAASAMPIDPAPAVAPVAPIAPATQPQ